MQAEEGAGRTAPTSLASERRARFARALYESGRVPVAIGSLAAPAPEGVPPVLAAALREIDELARAAAPGEAPELDLAAAAWALERLHGGCRALVERSLSAQEVEALVSAPFPGERTAAALWSVDLMLRYLPDLLALARGIARDDALVVALERLAREWPLSAAGGGAGDAPPELPDALRADACLRGVLLDRVRERGAPALERIPWIADGLAAAVGAHPELAPRNARP